MGSRTLLGLLLVALVAQPTMAGMPAVFPEDIETALRLSGAAQDRLQAISFFAFGAIVATLLIKLLWNSISKDSRWLPPLSWSKAFALVLLWSSVFVLVLTMISGARELLTPGHLEESWGHVHLGR